jgi:hypothetical protein
MTHRNEVIISTLVRCTVPAAQHTVWYRVLVPHSSCLPRHVTSSEATHEDVKWGGMVGGVVWW